MATTKPTFKTLADFKATHDPDIRIPAKIQEGLKSLLAEGRESAEYELEFCKRAGINTSQIGKYRDQFAKHIITVRLERSGSPKNVWFADPAVAAKARG
jgi:hypothetical protein